MTAPSIDQLAMLVPCPRCDAEPYRMCVTRTGRKSKRAHSARCTPVLAAWSAGWSECAIDDGEDDAGIHAESLAEMVREIEGMMREMDE